jgi:Zn ribbon nucleic-acid-binding protein
MRKRLAAVLVSVLLVSAVGTGPAAAGHKPGNHKPPGGGNHQPGGGGKHKPPKSPGSGGGVESPTCYDHDDSVAAWREDAALTGTIGTVDNFTFYASTDGSCTDAQALVTVVQAAESSVRNTECIELGFDYAYPESLTEAFTGYTTMPTGWYMCATSADD